MANIKSYVQVPVDAGGKKLATALQTVGGDDVHLEYVVAQPFDYQITNVYSFSVGNETIGASADATNVGRVYVENDPDSLVIIAVRKIHFTSQVNSALATPTGPFIAVKRFTFTGNSPSGSTIGACLMDTNMTAKNSNWNVRYQSTGMVVTEGVEVTGFYPIASLTAVGNSTPVVDEWKPDPMYPLIIRAGQGIMVQQVNAGTASDTRRFGVVFEIAEVTLAAVS